MILAMKRTTVRSDPQGVDRPRRKELWEEGWDGVGDVTFQRESSESEGRVSSEVVQRELIAKSQTEPAPV